MALLLRTLARQGVCLSKPHYSVFYRHAAPMGTTAKDEMNKFWSKNAKLNRPMSPHLAIYQWSVPMMMSITFRGTGVGLSGGRLACAAPIHTLSKLITFSLCLAISAFALAALVLPGNYPHYLDLIHSLSVGPHLIGLAKFGLAFPLSFHTLNGIRHLCWDLGKGFRMPEVYRTGYTVIGLSIITSVAVAFFL